MKITEKLMHIQQELKAPKGQYNDFGKYKYRSLEDIQEAVKPLLKEYKCALVIRDELINEGERYYIRAEARLYDVETEGTIACTAYAREASEKKGMDDSQITGTASSYARKYCLNGLFAIDDTKDADTNEYRESNKKKAEAIEKGVPQDLPQKVQEELLTEISEKELDAFKKLCADTGLDYKEVWKQTGKAKDMSKQHLGLASRWVIDHTNARADK